MTWTLYKAAQEFGVSRTKLRRALADIGVAKKNPTTREIFAALAGDVRAERIALLKAQRRREERRDRAEERELIGLAEARTICARVIAPLVEKVKALPRLAAQCNPENPDIAEAAIKPAVNAILAHASKADKAFAK